MSDKNFTCYLCKSSEDNPLQYGEIKSLKDLQVHYYCLLVTSSLVQNGSEDDPNSIFGFLYKDIKHEGSRTKFTKCCYCKKAFANITCCAKKCLKFFHTTCGFKNNCLSEYKDTFRSFCDRHVQQSKVKHTSNENCAICLDEMGEFNNITSILSPCCRTAWFHKECLQMHAANSGYFFKCPKCNNTDIFNEEIPNKGIFIPEKDAAWETEPNAFSELTVRPHTCEAIECKCPDGRDRDDKQGTFELMICLGCGSKAVHQACLLIGEDDDIYYVCQDCDGKVPRSVIEQAFKAEDNNSNSNSDIHDDLMKHDDSDKEEIITYNRRKRRRSSSDGQCSSRSSLSRNTRRTSTTNKIQRRSRKTNDKNIKIKIPDGVKVHYDCTVVLERLDMQAYRSKKSSNETVKNKRMKFDEKHMKNLHGESTKSMKIIVVEKLSPKKADVPNTEDVEMKEETNSKDLNATMKKPTEKTEYSKMSFLDKMKCFLTDSSTETKSEEQISQQQENCTPNIHSKDKGGKSGTPTKLSFKITKSPNNGRRINVKKMLSGQQKITMFFKSKSPEN